MPVVKRDFRKDLNGGNRASDSQSSGIEKANDKGIDAASNSPAHGFKKRTAAGRSTSHAPQQGIMKRRAAPASGGLHLFHCVSAMSLRERAINFTGATMGMSKLTRPAALFSPRG